MELLMDVAQGVTRVALVDKGAVRELRVEEDAAQQLTGNIYKGRVQNTLPGMQAAFVDIGLNKNAFLYAGDVFTEQGDADFGVPQSAPPPAIRDVARKGQELLVQVVREPGGAKGPRVSTQITLPGRHIVLMPTNNYVGVSRRIEDEAERARLRAEARTVCPDNMGVIVRTAGEGMSAEHFARDLERLTALWGDIERAARQCTAPARVYEDAPLYVRALRDIYTEDVERVLVNDRAAFERAREELARFAPDGAGRVALYDGAQPLFARYGAEGAIEEGLSRKVWLKSGGYLIFDHTEALTVIDVNSGKFVGDKNLKDTVFKLNLEAAREIARQARLRNLGGIIIIDFVDMADKGLNDALVDALREAAHGDAARVNIAPVSALGLVEMTRKKQGKPLARVMKRPCPCCKGEGLILKPEYAARAALDEARRMRAAGTDAPLLIRACGDVVDVLRALPPECGVSIHVDAGMPPDKARVEAQVVQSGG